MDEGSQSQQPVQSQPTPQPVTQTSIPPVSVKPKSNLTVILVMIVILALGATGYFAYQTWTLQKQVADLTAKNRLFDVAREIKQNPTGLPVPPLPSVSGNSIIQNSYPVDAAANWKTYSDTTYKFTVKYPASWKTSSGDNGRTVNFDPLTPGNSISITVHDNPSSTEIHKWLIDKSIVPADNNISTHIGETDIMAAGVMSVMVTTSVNGGQTTVYIPTGIYVISIYNNIVSSSTLDEYTKNSDTLNQMISSINLIK